MFHQLLHLAVTLFRLLPRLLRQGVCPGGVGGILLRLAGKLHHGGGDLFNGTGLFGGSFRKRLTGGTYLFRSGRYLFHRLAYPGKHLVELGSHLHQCLTKDVFIGGDLHTEVQIPSGDPLQVLRLAT